MASDAGSVTQIVEDGAAEDMTIEEDVAPDITEAVKVSVQLVLDEVGA